MINNNKEETVGNGLKSLWSSSVNINMSKRLKEIKSEDIKGFEGLRGWLIVLAGFFCLATLNGVAYSFSIVFDAIREEFGVSSTTELLLPGCIIVGVYSIMGPIFGAINFESDLRPRTIIGALIAAIGVGGSIFIKNYLAFALVFGICAGTGFSLIVIPCLGVIGQWFGKSREKTTKFMLSGSGFGIFMCAQFLPMVLEKYRLRGYLIVVTVLCCLCAVAQCIFTPMNKMIRRAYKKRENQTDNFIMEKIKQEEKIRADQKLVNLIIMKKDEQRTTSIGSIDGMVLDINTDIIAITPSTINLYDQPLLSKEDIERITAAVIRRLKEEEGPATASAALSEGTMTNEEIKKYVSNSIISCINSIIVIKTASQNSLEQASSGDAGTNTMKESENEHIDEMVKSELFDDLKNKRMTFCIEDNVIETIVEEDETEVEAQDGATKKSQSSSTLSYRNEVVQIVSESNSFPLELFTRPAFLVIALCVILTTTQFLAPFYFLPMFLSDHNSSRTDISNLVSSFGVADIVGQFLSAFYSYKIEGVLPYTECAIINSLSLTLAALALAFLPWILSFYELFCVLAFLHVCLMSFSVRLQSSLVIEYLGLDALTGAYTFLLILQGFFTILAAPLAGYLFDSSQRNFCFLFLGVAGTIFFAALVNLLLPAKQKLDQCRRQRQIDIEARSEPLEEVTVS